MSAGVSRGDGRGGPPRGYAPAVQACPECESENPHGSRFCGACGGVLTQVCAACGAAATADQRFCGQCGTALAAPQPVRVPIAERRLCSLLFCDLVGFTTLSEGRDPEEVRELLSRYFEAARTIVRRYGGVVEKFIGDAVMAVWGTPVAVENDAERCVRAALDLVAAVAQLGIDAGVAGLAARAGVVTGEVAVTVGAAMEGMVAGDAVNTAARVQSAAAPGTVLVGETTRRLVEGAIGFVDAGTRRLKGKAEEQRLWQATRVLSGIGGSQRVDGLEAPVIGRGPELRLIKESFHASVDRRVPRLLLVTGAAGVGKSRLGWEFEKYVDGLAASLLWHRGRCLTYGDGVGFWALAEIVRQRLGIAEEDSVEVAAGRLDSGLAELVPDPTVREYVAPRLARLLGTSLDPEVLGREELFAGWRLFVESLAARAPVVLLIEDAQHADPALLEFLDHLLDWIRDLPVFVLVLARPELPGRPTFGVGRNRTILRLDPLDAASMDELVDALVPGTPDPARRVITARAQGIPLYAVETVRSLIDRDIVVPSGGHYRLVGDVGQLTVPDSLHALLAARLDALPAEVRAVAADAAVLGTTFSAESVLAVSGGDLPEVTRALAELLRRDVLEIVADPLSPERGSYGFAQQLLRQVAYDTLSRRDRKARHLAAAVHLRDAFAGDGEEFIDAIARHYVDALAAVPDDPDVPELHGLAVAALNRAGERGLRTGATRRAGDAFAAAAELLERSGGGESELDAAALWERAAAAALDGAAREEGLRAATRAQQLYAKHRRARDEARAHIQVARALREHGRLSEGRAVLLGAVEVLRADPDVATVRALNGLATLELFAGPDLPGPAPDVGAVTFEALALAQDLALPLDEITSALILRGIYQTTRGRLPEAWAYLGEAARLAENSGHARNLARALANLADALGPADPATSATVAARAADVARRVGMRRDLGIARVNEIFARINLGEWHEARMLGVQAIDEDGLGGEEFIVSLVAFTEALRGEAAAAESRLARLVTSPTSEDSQDRAGYALAAAHLALLDDPSAARIHAQAALDRVDGLGINHDLVRWTWPVAARAAHAVGDADDVRRLIAMLDGYRPGQLAPLQRAERTLAAARLEAGTPAATELFADAITHERTDGTPYHLAGALLDQADHLRAVGRPVEASVREAEDIAAHLGCRPLTERAARGTATVR